MPDLKLVIGDKNTSSWSLRPWLLLKQAGISFEEINVPLHAVDSKTILRRHSPSGRVPVLIDGDVRVWESLAICEYLAEKQRGLWPDDAAARAYARAISAEMHSGFATLRRQLPMNWLGRDLEADLEEPELKAEITRVIAIWHDARTRFGGSGPFLMGRFGIVDAMYAPVALRFVSYGVELDDVSRAYVDTLMALPVLEQWAQGAQEQMIAEAPPDADHVSDGPADEPGEPAMDAAEPTPEAKPTAPRRRVEIKPIGGGILRRRSGTPRA